MSAPRRILVVGGGVTAWSAAAALKRRVPMLDVAILAAPIPDNALADRIASTLPSILGFHDDLGIGIEDAVLRTGSAYRLGTQFRGWSGNGSDYVHCYGPHGQAMSSAPFHLLWARAAAEGTVAPFHAFSVAAAMAAAGRFVLPQREGLLADHGFGLVLDLPRYAAMLAAFCRHVGVRIEQGQFAAIVPSPEGGIAGVTRDDGSAVAADLYLDCTGPAARLHAALDAPREDWRRWLPCDRLSLSTAMPADLSAVEAVDAEATGWRWESALQSGRVFVNAGGEQDGAVAIDACATLEPWRHNVIAIGDAAVGIEPLEWTNLHLAHSAIDRVIAMLPAGDPHPLEQAEYNRQSLAEARRARDFVLLHYVTSQREATFWQDIASTAPPESLAHTLRLFRERGRLPFYEEETFDRDSWLAVLFGQGVRPRRIDPLAEAVPPAEAAQAMDTYRARLAQAMAPLPTPAAFRAAQLRQLHERA